MLLFGENVLWLLVLIGVMIMIHELGHFWAARYFDVKVEAFSFGFGPRLFGFRRGDTDYRFSLILLGGYVKMAGEQPSDENVDDPRGFLSKPRWQRLIIAFAGPLMNMVLAVALLTGLYMVKFQKVADEDMQAVIGHVMVDSPAAKAGIQDNDRIVRLDNKKNPTWEDVGLKEIASAYRPMYLTIERNGKFFDTAVTPTLGERSGMGFAGWDERGQIQLGAVEAGMPAEKAGLKKGDLLVTVNGQPIHSQIKFQEITKNSGGKPIEIEFQRDGQSHVVTVQPVFSSVDAPARWMIGVIPQQKLRIITTKLSFASRVQRIHSGQQQRRAADCAVPERDAGAPHVAQEPVGTYRHRHHGGRRGSRRSGRILPVDVHGQPQPRHLQPAADPDSGRRGDSNAAGGNDDAARSQHQRQGSGI